MRATSAFRLEAGIWTVSCAARIALRIRVRKSAIGSVIDMLRLLPGGLSHPGDLTIVGELAQADAAQPELAVDRMRTAAAIAASICTCLELRWARLLNAQ